MRQSSFICTLLFGCVSLGALPAGAQDTEAATKAETPKVASEEVLTPPPPLPAAYQRKAPNKVPEAKTFAAEEEGEQKNLLLRDGTRVRGKVLRADAEFIVLETAIGELSVPRTAIQPTYLRLEFIDGDIIVGELLAENETSFLIDGVFGQMEIRRDQIVGFERAYFKDQLARIPGTSSGSADSFVQGQKNSRRQNFSHSSIEPLIDIFFSPTGYTFQEGDIYVSGFSLGYGFTDNFHATVNILELVGLNGNGSPNLRATTKWNFLKKKNAKREWLMAAVLAGDVHTRLGSQQVTKRNVGLTRSSTEDDYWQITQDSTLEVTTTRNSNFFGGDSDDNGSIGGEYIGSVQDGDDYWQCYGNTAPNENALSATADCERDGSDTVAGPRGQLFLANTYSWLLDRGGRFGWHSGVRLSMDQLNYQNWVADPTYRVYSAFDLDLNSRFKLLGEVFYDPNYKAIFTNVEDIGLDFGMMYAFTPDFRVLVHLEGPFIGLFWRF